MSYIGNENVLFTHLVAVFVKYNVFRSVIIRSFQSNIDRFIAEYYIFFRKTNVPHPPVHYPACHSQKWLLRGALTLKIRLWSRKSKKLSYSF